MIITQRYDALVQTMTTYS
ncbi:Protein of unknown function [Pyronema omphalodes CBS 100304]|uniref:Uncharacterized protein n=1 Tax=Pyronema omphalodes (strain CBS 100304) TaxID=1076935 RepID=U4L6C4_PYROM|nr:Protein of unknown function [Pyronema omphalodes CBS 100304]